MANNQNLKPFNTLPAERHRELSKKGGVASGMARRAKRAQIDAEKTAQAANHELYHDCVEMLYTCARAFRTRL